MTKVWAKVLYGAGVKQFLAEKSDLSGIGKPITLEQPRIREWGQQNQTLRQDLDILKKRLPSLSQQTKKYQGHNGHFGNFDCSIFLLKQHSSDCVK